MRVENYSRPVSRVIIARWRTGKHGENDKGKYEIGRDDVHAMSPKTRGTESPFFATDSERIGSNLCFTVRGDSGSSDY